MLLPSRAAQFLFLFVAACPSQAQTTTLNVSHDLVSRGIWPANMVPGNPQFNSRPPLEAAIAYASQNGITNVIADPGSYYFTTQRNANTHVLISGVSNLRLNFQNSDLYFKNSNVSAIQCTNCTNVTLEKFTVDYQQLPFTQVTVTSVNPAAPSFTYQTVPGYQDPTEFNANRAPDNSDQIFMWVFHNGVPIREVGRLSASRPVSGGVIKIADTKDPWATAAALSAIQPGDTVVFSNRSGPPTLNIVNGSNVTIQNVSVYSGGQIGVYFGRTNGAAADHVQVIPRPGTTRLISTNADGIHTSFATGANVFTNNIVRRTCDDALAISAAWLATVTKADGTTVTVSRNFASAFPVGMTVAFINDDTAAVIGTATISSETPAAAQQTLTDQESVTLTLDRAVPGLAADFGMLDTDPAKLGSGSKIAFNTVQDGVFARGVWLAGVQSVTVQDNFIQRTSSNGIFVQQLNADRTVAGPSSNITIKNNLVDGALAYGNVSHGVTFAAASIYTIAQSSQNGQVTTSPHANIAVTGNRVTNSARSAVRLENVNVGQITGNTIQGFGLAPTVNVYNAPPGCCETLAQYEADFAQAVLTPSSVSITTNGNTSSGSGGAIQNSSTASGYPRLGTGSFAAAYGANLSGTTATAEGTEFPTTLGGVSVSITDSAGVARQAGVQYVSPEQVNYLVPTDMAPGIATVTIGSSSGAAQIDSIGPGLYALNANNGVAAATAALYTGNGQIIPAPVFDCSADCKTVPMSLGGSGDMLAVSFYGTGFRAVSSAADASVTIGGIPAQILYVGAQPSYPGLDQLNVVIPAALAGAGDVPAVLTVNGQTANAVVVNVR